MLVLIPKGNTYTWGVEMLEVVWQVVKVVIYSCIKTAVQFHYALYGFCTSMGVETQ